MTDENDDPNNPAWITFERIYEQLANEDGGVVTNLGDMEGGVSEMAFNASQDRLYPTSIT